LGKPADITEDVPEKPEPEHESEPEQATLFVDSNVLDEIFIDLFTRDEIERRRKEENLSQTELGRRVGTSKATVSDIINRKQKTSVFAVPILKILNIPVPITLPGICESLAKQLEPLRGMCRGPQERLAQFLALWHSIGDEDRDALIAIAGRIAEAHRAARSRVDVPPAK